VVGGGPKPPGKESTEEEKKEFDEYMRTQAEINAAKAG